jgi:hypothetical protein
MWHCPTIASQFTHTLKAGMMQGANLYFASPCVPAPNILHPRAWAERSEPLASAPCGCDSQLRGAKTNFLHFPAYINANAK